MTRDERERDRRALAQHVEDLDQRPAVLAAGQPDHDAVAVLDQVVLGDRLGDLLGEARFERRGVAHDVRHQARLGPFSHGLQSSCRQHCGPCPASVSFARRATSSAVRAQPLGERRVVHHAPQRRRQRLRRRIADEAADAVLDELGRPAAVAARDDGLARGERLDGDEPVVLLERREADRAAAREVIEQLRLGEAARERDAVRETEPADERPQPVVLLAVAGDDGANPGRLGRAPAPASADRRA